MPQKNQAEEYKEGRVILIDKPLHWTSFQVVNKLRWLLRKKLGIPKIKIGHGGTLDPLATGLLVICSGKFTKKLAEFQNEDKEYTGIITLGATTPSYDLETEIDQRFDISEINPEQIHDAAQRFVGEIEQEPPVFSAVRKDGKRLYEYARKGEEVEIPKRLVTVYEFEIVSINLPEVHFRIRCSKGTYIRSLAHDFGKALQNGAHLSALRRTMSGSFSVEDAMTIEAFEANLIR